MKIRWLKLIAAVLALALPTPLRALASAPGPGLPGYYSGTLPDEGRTLYLSLKLTDSADHPGKLFRGSFVVGTGPGFATISFPSLAWDPGTDAFAGDGSGSYEGRPLLMSLRCLVKSDGSLDCVSAYPQMPSASFVLRK